MFKKLSRVRLGAALLVLAFLPFLPIKFLPDFWATVPAWARWGAYAIGGLSCAGIVALVFTADYGEGPAPTDG